MTKSPVLILNPSQVPPATTSLPAKILGSSSKLENGVVYLFANSSRLKAKIKRKWEFGCSWKKVMHMMKINYK